MAPAVVLVGPPGSGKTTVGRALADELGVPFRDTDDDVERLAGRSVPDIFVTSGEAEFRRLERDAVAVALAEHDGVLAIGGGAVESERTRAALAEEQVVYLTVSPGEAAKRVGVDGPRPLLLGNVRTKWHELMTRREPWYADVATVTVSTSGRSVADVVGQVRHAVAQVRS